MNFVNNGIGPNLDKPKLLQNHDPEYHRPLCRGVWWLKNYIDIKIINVIQLFLNMHRQTLAERLGGSLGLVVKAGDSSSHGWEFESWHRILDGLFSHLFIVRIVMFV